jgi:hypothetical protein
MINFRLSKLPNLVREYQRFIEILEFEPPSVGV